MIGAWDDVKVMAERAPDQAEQVAKAQVLLSMRSRDPNTTTEALRTARNILGAPIARRQDIEGPTKLFSTCI
jgi:hypothetical protein